MREVETEKEMKWNRRDGKTQTGNRETMDTPKERRAETEKQTTRNHSTASTHRNTSPVLGLKILGFLSGAAPQGMVMGPQAPMGLKAFPHAPPRTYGRWFPLLPLLPLNLWPMAAQAPIKLQPKRLLHRTAIEK